MKNILKLALLLLPMTVLAQAPQIPLTGNIGSGFNGPLIYSPAVVFATDADHTMVYPEMSGSGGTIILTSTPTLTATRNLLVPNTGVFNWFVKNETTGGQTVNVKVSGGTSVAVANGATVFVVCDGVNCTTQSNASGTVTAVTATSPVVSTGGTTPNISLPNAVTGPGGSGVVVGHLATMGNTSGTSIVDGGPVPTTPTGPANEVVATPNGSSGASGLRALVSADLPFGSSSQAGALECGTGTICTGGVLAVSALSSNYRFLSDLPCIHQNTDLTNGGGTSDTVCINNAIAAVPAGQAVTFIQDKSSLIDGVGIQIPPAGNVSLIGLGGGLAFTNITACGITGGNLATFTTTPNQLNVGQYIQLTLLSNCSALNNTVVQVLSTGLTSTSFEATVSASNVSSAAETATGVTVNGTGFYLASGSADVISNGNWLTSGACGASGSPPSRGANVTISDLIINGNSAGQTNYCYGLDLPNLNNLTVENVVLYNMYKYGIYSSNLGLSSFRGVKVFSSTAVDGLINTDAIHIGGNSNDITASDGYCHTGDDCISLVANEGYSGPISRVTISNYTSWSSLCLLRLDSEDPSFPIDTVTVSNFSGSFYGVGLNLGFFNGGSISNVTWDNSILTATSPAYAFVRYLDNVNTLSFSNITFSSPPNSDSHWTNGIFWGPMQTSPVLQNLFLHDIKILFTPSGSTLGGLFFSTSGNTYINNLIVDGAGVYNVGGSYSPLACLICDTGGTLHATQVLPSNIDLANITSLIKPTGSNITLLGGEWVSPSYGTTYCINATGVNLCPPGSNPTIMFDPSLQEMGTTGGSIGQTPIEIHGEPAPVTYFGTGGYLRVFGDMFYHKTVTADQAELGTAGTASVLIDGTYTGHNLGNVGVGYGEGSIVPYPFSVAGIGAFGCVGTTCGLTIDATGKPTMIGATSGTYMKADGTGYGTPSGSGTTANALTAAASGGAAPGSTFNGSAAVTFDYHSVGASPLAGSTSLTTLGTITTGVWNGTALTSTYLPAVTVYNNQANAYTTGLQDFSAVAMKLPTSYTEGSGPYTITQPGATGTLALTSQIGSWGALNYPTWSSGTPFVKMTAAGTFALDTNTYLTSSTGLLATGATPGATSQPQAFTDGIIAGATSELGPTYHHTWVEDLGYPNLGAVIYLVQDNGTNQSAIRLHASYGPTHGYPNFDIDYSTTTQDYNADPSALTYTNAMSINGNTGAVGFPGPTALGYGSTAANSGGTQEAICLADGTGGCVTVGGTPTIAAGAGAGTSPTVSVIGFDVLHLVTVTTGSAPSSNAVLATITLSASRGHYAYCVASPENSAAAAVAQIFSNESGSDTVYSLNVGATALTASTTYSWNVTCP